MNVLIMAVLLTVMQTAPPIPGKTTDTGSNKSNNAQNGAKAENDNTTASLAVKQQSSPQPSESTRPDQTPKNKEYSVAVGKLPTVSTERDWIDYTALGISVLLCIAAFFAARYALRTLKAIEGQTKHLVNAERAWIQVPEVIMLQKLSFYIPPPGQLFVWLHPYIINNGKTQARITKITARAQVLDKDTGDGLPPDRPPQLPEHPEFRPSDTLIERNIILSPEQGINWIKVYITPEELERIKQKQSFVYVYGRIDYADLSGTGRQTGFCKLYWIPEGGVEDFIDSAVVPLAYTECT
jgi:hypothetical protein